MSIIKVIKSHPSWTFLSILLGLAIVGAAWADETFPTIVKVSFYIWGIVFILLPTISSYRSSKQQAKHEGVIN